MIPLPVELLAGELVLAWRAAGHDRGDAPRHLAHETRDLGDGRLRLAFATEDAAAHVDLDPDLLVTAGNRALVANRLLAGLHPG